MNDKNAWDIYWQSGHKESCISDSYDALSNTIRNIWIEAAKHLTHKVEILDLATGNGSVPRILSKLCTNTKIIGVDRANVFPLNNEQNSNAIELIPNIDITDLPFSKNRFDLVTSQFGFEYADENLALPQVYKVLKEGGSFRFISHHSNSKIVTMNNRKLYEFKRLFETNGLIDTISQYTLGAATSSQLLEVKQDYMNGQFDKSNQISGQLIKAVDYFISQAPSDTLHTQAKDMIARIHAEQSRIEQMSKASLDENDSKSFKALAKQLGFKDVASKVIEVDQNVIGWLLTGKR
ncbi:class I SAM-dependent methyltransferase [Paraglaciecola sp. 2405UD69-4]|uniref:class I SAM-dependent methyltransferase n=1 Tax=Paraglaciecola sp. 2405UD69-4 TaxID=3391836 RepID=UPI0039C9D92E